MKRQVTIHIGEFYAGREPTVIYTLLGSCVAVCLHDRINRIGGMNHILLPGKADLKEFDSTARYGINAMELLINKIMMLGGKRSFLTAKVFGGGHVLPSISLENGVGKKNVEFVLDFLEIESIKVINSDVGGRVSRKLYFHTDTGEVLLKRIPHTMQSQISAMEKEQLERLKQEHSKPGGITIFQDDDS